MSGVNNQKPDTQHRCNECRTLFVPHNMNWYTLIRHTLRSLLGKVRLQLTRTYMWLLTPEMDATTREADPSTFHPLRI